MIELIDLLERGYKEVKMSSVTGYHSKTHFTSVSIFFPGNIEDETVYTSVKLKQKPRTDRPNSCQDAT